MNKRLKKLIQTLQNQKQQTNRIEGQQKLKNIIKTFRQNNLKLIQKLYQCDRIRDNQQIIYKRKPSDKYLLQKNDFSNNRHIDNRNKPRVFSQMKTDNNIKTIIKDNSIKQNITSDFDSYANIYQPKYQNCLQVPITQISDKNFKLVKIKANKLVPLSIDKLREKLRVL